MPLNPDEITWDDHPAPQSATASAAPDPNGVQWDAPAPQDKQDLPGFSDDQKRAILDYIPQAKDAADLEQFSREISGGSAHIGNAQKIIELRDSKQHQKEFGWAPPTLGKPEAAPPKSLPEKIRDKVGDSMLSSLDNVVPGLGTYLRAHQEAGKAFTEHAANAMAFDYGPEVGGLIDTIIHGGDLDRNVAHNRATLSGDSEGQAPASAAGELTGVALAAPLGGAAAEAANLGKVGQAARMVSEGAAYGSGAAGPGNRAEGAAIGAVAAPLLAGAGKAAVALTGAGKSVLEGTPGLARRIISKAIKQDLNTPESVGQTIADAHANNVPMALGDTGENVRGLMAASSRASGVGRTIVRDALEERQSQLADRITGHIERDLGPVANPHEVADQLMTKAQSEAAPIYDKFYSQPSVSSPAIDSFLNRPSMQKALKNAYSLAQEEGRSPEALGLRMGEDGKVQLERGQPLGIAESAKANPNRFNPVDIPNEFDELKVRAITTPNGRKVHITGPVDMTQRLRMMGGIKDDSGVLAHLGITNAPRRMSFGSNEQFLGKLVNNEKGMSLDDATHALWEDGYFPEFSTRPTPHELLDRLREENMGTARYFDPADTAEVDNFHAAQSSRYKLEQAASGGAPFAHDATSPTNYQDAINRQGPTVAGRQPQKVLTYTPQTLDYIKRGMDDVVESYRDPTSGRLNLDTEGRAVNNTLRSYMSVVDKLYPDYAAARSTYAGPVKGISAMNAGRKFLNMTADDIEARMRDMTPYEKQMAALGTRRAMAELVQSKGDTADVVNALVGTGKKRAMLARLFGNRQQFSRFVDTLGQEKEGWRSFRQALLGSPTAANVQDDAALQGAALAADFMGSGGVASATVATGKAMKFMGRKLSEKAQQQIAALLSNTDPAAIRELAAELRAKAEQRGINISRITNIGGKGAAIALQPQQAQ